MRFIIRWLFRLILLAVIAGAVAVYFAPSEPFETEASFDEATFDGDVAAYFAETEAAIDDITPGTEKRVVWAGDAGAVTPLSILYVHGFSATSEEIRPVPDQVAEALGANLVFTRLTGHGRPGAALAEATVEAWMHDMAEALAAAGAIGDEVIVMATSTGGTLATIAATDPVMTEDVKGMIFVSPNFRVADPAATILTWPAVRWWGPVLAGEERYWEPMNEAHGTYTTHRYPTVALLPMAASVHHARNLDHGQIDIPVLKIYSPDDSVVSADATRAVATRWGGPVTRVEVNLGEGDDPNDHVLMGDMLSPGQTEFGVQTMLDWINGL